MSETCEHRAAKWSDRVQPEVVRKILVYEISLRDLVAKLDNFKYGLSDAYSRIKASTRLSTSNTDHGKQSEGDGQAGKETVVGRSSFTSLHKQVDHYEDKGANNLNLKSVGYRNIRFVWK